MFENIIYYCWFGKTPLPERVKKCIKTWRYFFPDYQIIEINETNFNINCCTFVQQSYIQKKYAFVSDYARLFYLNKTGGIYFDTDVLVSHSFSELLQSSKADIIFSMEYFSFEVTGINTACIISKKNQLLFMDMLDLYQKIEFFSPATIQTINLYLTRLLDENTAFKYKDREQILEYQTQIIKIVPSTILMRKGKGNLAVHLLDGSWVEKLSFTRKWRRFLGIILKKIIGRRMFENLWENMKK